MIFVSVLVLRLTSAYKIASRVQNAGGDFSNDAFPAQSVDRQIVIDWLKPGLNVLLFECYDALKKITP